MDAVAPEIRNSFSPAKLRSAYAHNRQMSDNLGRKVTKTHLEKCCCGPSLQVKHRLVIGVLQPRKERPRP